jgi:hypothetical protein
MFLQGWWKMLLLCEGEFRRKCCRYFPFLFDFLHILSYFKWAGAKEFCRQGEMTLLRIEDYEEDYSIFGYGKYNPGKKLLINQMATSYYSFRYVHDNRMNTF